MNAKLSVFGHPGSKYGEFQMGVWREGLQYAATKWPKLDTKQKTQGGETYCADRWAFQIANM
jgi:hypothetical protein